ncbi:MAG: hypothetical protein IJQ56_01555 [Synergistaceae bacterium]|nr:hypothetical protein [Synergistaceae bacterium]MBR0203030.1 hypothetical protein [Synergistaceae bacterium]
MAARLIAVISIIIFTFSGVSFCNEKINITVTHPWLALLASFIGGAEVSVTPLRIWNKNGDLSMSDRGRILKELESGSKIIALDKSDAEESGINDRNKDKFSVKYLYSPFPVSYNALYDPSVIPFVAQRVLNALSEWDVQNYSYYQRRLAEFQARLSSSVLVGQVLKDITICDLTGSAGVLLKAAGCKVNRSEKFDEWQKGNLSGFREYLDLQRSKGSIILIDDDTPANITRSLSRRPDVYKWERPPLDVDYPAFLYEQYISLWQKITAKPLPGRNKTR